MRKQGILLEHSIQLSLVGRHPRYVLSIEDDFSLIRHCKTADDPESRRLSAAARAEKSHERVFLYGKI